MVINFYTATSFINFATSALIAVFVVLKGKKKKEKWGFFFLFIFVALWSLSYFLWQGVAEDPVTALFWVRVLTFFIILISPSLLYFSLSFTEYFYEKKHIFIVACAAALIFIIFDCTPYLVNEVRPIMNFKYWPTATPLFSALVAYFTLTVGYSFLLLIKKYETSSGIIKLQTKYISIGFIAAMISGSINFIPWYGISIPPVTNAIVPIYVILLGYTITRYRLMNIKLAARNIFYFFVLAFIFYITFYLIAFIYEIFFGGIFEKGAYILGIFIAPVIAILMYSGSDYLSKFTNRYLFPSMYEYQRTIIKVSHELSHYTNLSKIINIITNTINEVIKPQDTTIFLVNGNKLIPASDSDYNKKSILLDINLFSDFFKNESSTIIREELDQIIKDRTGKKDISSLIKLREQMNQNGIYVCFALKNRNNFSGIITLNERKDEDSYTQEDIRLLEILSYQAGIAINNAILYKKIEEKNEYLQELIDIKNDFIRIASHQLNTPLSIMRLAYSMVKDKTITLREGMKYWGNGIERMSKVIKDFWQFLEFQGEFKTRPEAMDILSEAKEIISERKKILLKHKKIKILIKENPEIKPIPKVFCDTAQISSAFSSLLDNAIAYTPEGSITVSYELSDGGKYLKINIEDTGIGFSQEDAKKIGEKFFRTKESVLTRPDGSGLGVYICKKFVEENKGIFSFKSDGKDKGATFSFELPVYIG